MSDLFGPTYAPDYGWDFGQFGQIEVGSVGKIERGVTAYLVIAYVSARLLYWVALRQL